MKASEFAVLVVDDDPMVVSALKFFAETRGYGFTSAGGVAEAKRALASQPADMSSSTSTCPTATASTCSTARWSSIRRRWSSP